MVYSIEQMCGTCKSKDCVECVASVKAKIKKRKAKAYVKNEHAHHADEK